MPVELVRQVAKDGKLPVVLFCAGGISGPTNAALMMQLGAEGNFVGSGIFKSADPARRAKAIVEATTHFRDAKLIAEVSRAENNFKSFAPILKQIIELKQRVAECYGYTDHIYDALLDVYEPGMKTADVEAMFSDLRYDVSRNLKKLVEDLPEPDLNGDEPGAALRDGKHHQ